MALLLNLREGRETGRGVILKLNDDLDCYDADGVPTLFNRLSQERKKIALRRTPVMCCQVCFAGGGPL